MLWLMLIVGCGGSDSAAPEPKVDGWMVARDHLRTDSHNCFAGLLPYCDTSEAFIDPILQETVNRQFDGEMPDTELRAVRVARRARATYANEQHRTEEARLALLERIEAYYEAPATFVKGSTLNVEVGVVPGHWEQTGRSGYSLMPGDKMLAADWRISEAVRFTQRLLADNPDAQNIAMSVRLPQMGGAGGYRKQTWTYRSSTQRLSLTEPGRPTDSWHTEKITDWAAFAEAAKTMDREAMLYCGGTGEDEGCSL